MTIHELVSLLHGVHKSANGWEARCPAHEDKRASLSISEGDTGIVLCCHTGCTIDAICVALGIKPADLFYEPHRKRRALPPPRPRPPKASPQPSSNGMPHDELVASMERSLGQPVAKSWPCRLADGTHVGTILRWNLPDGKAIRQISVNGDGQWHAKAMPDPKPLMNLPELLANPDHVVYVVEGEPAMDAGMALGLLTVTSCGGSEAPSKTDWSPLAGRNVVILPDNDAAGGKYRDKVVNLLMALDDPPDVRVVILPGLPEAGDLVDYVEAHDDKEAGEIAQAIEDLAACAPLAGGNAHGQPILRCVADVEPRQISWLWPGRIPMGRITLLVGRPGEGKSFLTTDLAARISTGSPWPDENGLAPHGQVILVTGEDDPHDTVRPRLDAHGANVHLIHLLEGTNYTDSKTGKTNQCLFSLTDIGPLKRSLRRYPGCKLVIIDPIGSFLGSMVDAHRDNEVRAILAPLAQLADRHEVAMLLVAHRRKSSAGLADDLVLGSRAFTGIARSVYHLSRDAANHDRRLLLPGKNNLAREGYGLAFTICGDPPFLSWEKGAVTMSADEALAAESRKPGPAPAARLAAEDWLKSLLAAGSLPSGDKTSPAAGSVRAEAHDAGLSWRTVRRAADALGVRFSKDGLSGGWRWSLPSCPTPGNVDNLATL